MFSTDIYANLKSHLKHIVTNQEKYQMLISFAQVVID